jgi:excisionase family DNA binding protein
MDEYLTVKAVAQRLAISQMMVLRLIKAGRISANRIGSIWRIPSVAVERYLTESLTK